jgi:TonB-dependent receptor
MKKGVLIFVATLISIGVYAQKGYLRGKILDGESGEGLIGATVYKEGTSTGAVADFDGNYSITLEPGTHNIVFQFISYQTQTIQNVEIKSDEVTTLDITLSSVTEQLEEIVITAEQIKDNEVALLSLQKKSPNVVNGISSQAFRKMGDGDLGNAMKRVTGVSVEGGKYVYVRGLGDRYTKTTLNEMVIPGLDPDRNTVQIDIFPTSTIENVVVYKTFTPNLPGDFTGGIVNVETKNFPEEKVTQVSVGMEVNPDMHFNSDYVTYDGSPTDIVGFDNGLRELPLDKNQNIPDISSNEGFLVEYFTKSFTPKMSAKKKPSFMNYSLNINHGNQINRSKATWGYNMVLNYQNKKEFYSNAEFGEYAKNPDSEVNDLSGFQIRRGPIGNSDVLWSGLVAGALKYNKHSYSLMLLHNQNGVSQTTNRVSQDLEDNPATLLDDILTYAQRQVTNGIVIGQHNFEKFKLEWRGSLTNSRIYEPDFRITRIEEIPVFDSEGNQSGYRYSLNTGVGAGINRFWRELNEQNESFKLDIAYPYGEKNELKFGGMTLFKQRTFEVLEYNFRVRDRGNITITDNPDDFFLSENIWTQQTNEGTFSVAKNSEIENKVNSFDASSATHGFYAMTEHYFTNKFRTIFGVRAEMAKMYYSGRNQQGEELEDALTLDELNWLPSLNLVYEFNDKINLRASYNKTLARPSFKEKSNAQIYDPISDRFTIGNLDLNQTNIDNYDLRWEYYFGAAEMISTAVFYKNFEGHIERVAFQTAPEQLTFKNAGNSIVYGAELEFRKNLFSGFSLGTNISVVKSEIDMNDIIVNEDAQGNTVTEKENRELWARDGENIKDTRDMVGQAPYLINGNLNWNNKENTLNANISYNVQGETLSIVGSGRWPDIYTAPFHSLNFNIYKDFGINKNSRLNLRVTNILDAKRKDVYKSYGASERVYSLFNPGRAFALVYRFTF